MLAKQNGICYTVMAVEIRCMLLHTPQNESMKEVRKK